MLVKPCLEDLQKWMECVPKDGDLIFLSNRKIRTLEDQPFDLFTRAQARKMIDSFWSLNNRSWYGYALSQADFCAWLPIGMIENLSVSLKEQLREEQLYFQVPTILNDIWVTSMVWSEYSISERVDVIRWWLAANEVYEYESQQLVELPPEAKKEIARVGYDRLVNKFADTSGPNCFATVCGALNPKQMDQLHVQWMNWPTFRGYLEDFNYHETLGTFPKTGDVLVFKQDNSPIHAAYCLSGDYFFEKPGQDFYEPYRIERFSKWESAWPGTKLSIWRKKES